MPEDIIKYARGSLKVGNKTALEMLRQSREEDRKHDEFLLKTLLLNMPIEIIDVDINLALVSAEVKVNQTIAFGDCFAIGLTKLKTDKVISGDPELKVKSQNYFEIRIQRS